MHTLFTNSGQNRGVITLSTKASKNHKWFKIAQNLLKPSLNYDIFVSSTVHACKIINVKKQSFSTNALSNLRYDVSWCMSVNPIVSYLWTILINLALFTNDLKFGARVHSNMSNYVWTTMTCQFGLSFSKKKSCKN